LKVEEAEVSLGGGEGRKLLRRWRRLKTPVKVEKLEGGEG